MTHCTLRLETAAGHACRSSRSQGHVPRTRPKALTAARATPNGMEPPRKTGIIQTMYEHVIQQALWDVQDLLCANLALRHGHLPDDRAVACLKTIVGAPNVQRAIERGNDTAQSFVLRGANHVLSDPLLPPSAVLAMLWSIMDLPEIEWRMTQASSPSLRKKPPAL